MPSRVRKAGSTSSPLPVDSANTVSPSNGVCAGRIARASPSCAIIAKRRQAFLPSGASVATTAIVVFAPANSALHAEKSSGSSGAAGIAGCGGISPASASSAAHSRPQSGRTIAPHALTATIAPTVAPSPRRSDALPTPPLSRPALAPSPAPALPSANSLPARAAASRPSRRCGGSPLQCRRPGKLRSKRIAAGTIGTRASPTAKPRPCAASQSMTPAAASSPNAEPPDSTIASTRSTSVAGPSSSVSRLPGAPPRTSTAATAGASAITTVAPVIAA